MVGFMRAFVLKNSDGQYYKYKRSWCADIKGAEKFSTMEETMSYIKDKQNCVPSDCTPCRVWWSMNSNGWHEDNE